MQIGRVDLNKMRGLVDKGLGLTKEVVGTLAGSERLQEEGEAQQARATEQLRALRKEAEAEAKRAKANALETRQRQAQYAKEG
jgi:uncharacterized protein YjbJ (UPF0337 family)